MGQDPYRKTQRGGANLGGIAMVFVAVVLGLLLSTSVLWYETGQRAAAQVASAAAAPAASPAPATPAAPTAASAPTTAAAPTVAPTQVPPPTAASTQAPSSTAAPKAAAAATQAPKATDAPTAVPAKSSSAPAVASAGSVDAGSKVFAATCNACHPGGGEGLGPSLKGVSPAEVTKTVRAGRDMMPAFSTAEVSDQQLQDIVAYLGSLK